MENSLREFTVEISLDEGEIRRIEKHTGITVNNNADLYRAIFQILHPILMPDAPNPVKLEEIQDDTTDYDW